MIDDVTSACHDELDGVNLKTIMFVNSLIIARLHGPDVTLAPRS